MPGNYTQVFEGNLGTNDLERIYAICRDSPPPGYRGYRMALSDVVELYDASGASFITATGWAFVPSSSARVRSKQNVLK